MKGNGNDSAGCNFDRGSGDNGSNRRDADDPVFEATGHLAVAHRLQEQDALGADPGIGEHGIAVSIARRKSPCRATHKKAGTATSADTFIVKERT